MSISVGLDRETLVELVEHRQTPLYVYDLDLLTARIAGIRAAIRDQSISLFFATMANDRMPVLQRVACGGVGACVNSIPHLELAEAAGFDASRTQFTATGVAAADMRSLIDRDIRLNADSLAQLETWFKLGGKTAGLRINAAALTGRTPCDRIGVESAVLPAAQELARRHGAAIEGIHVYVGTNYQRAEDMFPTLRAFFALASRTCGLRYVNVGGGVGVDYAHAGPAFDLDLFGAELRALADGMRRATGETRQVIFEPGRGLVANCAVLLTRVTDKKTLGGDCYVAVDASIAVFPRPLLHPDTPHRIRALRSPPTVRSELAIVVGRTTFSKDILGTALVPADLAPGDVLAIEDAGAYSQSMSSRFLGQPAPEEVYLSRSAGGDVAVGVPGLALSGAPRPFSSWAKYNGVSPASAVK